MRAGINLPHLIMTQWAVRIDMNLLQPNRMSRPHMLCACIISERLNLIDQYAI